MTKPIVVFRNFVKAPKNTESLEVASKERRGEERRGEESRLGVHDDKTQCMAMSREQNARRSHSINTDNNSTSFERAKQFRYLGTTLTNQNSIQEEIKP